MSESTGALVTRNITTKSKEQIAVVARMAAPGDTGGGSNIERDAPEGSIDKSTKESACASFCRRNDYHS